MHSSVPHGSVLGPIIFTISIKSLSTNVDSHCSTNYLFHDFVQLHVSAPPDNISKITELLHSKQSCISDVKGLTSENMLKFNDNKTECFSP